MSKSKLIFITGTDTGVGKTVVSSCLIRCLRRSGVRALGVKPFCSGGRDDAIQLVRAQDGELTLDECNPFHFSEPLAPAVAARRHRKRIALERVLERIETVRRLSEVLVVEGAGGVMAPLGEGYTALTLMENLGCDEVLVVGRNQLGTINHTLLTCAAIARVGGMLGKVNVVLSDVAAKGDASSDSNARVLRERLPGIGVSRVPYMGANPFAARAFARNEKKIKKVLARIIGSAIFAARQTRRV